MGGILIPELCKGPSSFKSSKVGIQSFSLSFFYIKVIDGIYTLHLPSLYLEFPLSLPYKSIGLFLI
jgi:hypothetical protein